LPVPSPWGCRRGCARARPTPPTSPATPPATSATGRATATISIAWIDSAPGDLVDRRVARVKDGAAPVRHHQQVELDELVPLALEQAGDAAAGRDAVANVDDAVVGDVADDVHPRTETHVGAEDPVRRQQEVARVGGTTVAVEVEVLVDLVQE